MLQGRLVAANPGVLAVGQDEVQRVHVLSGGRVVATGGSELAEIVDRTGYAAYT